MTAPWWEDYGVLAAVAKHAEEHHGCDPFEVVEEPWHHDESYASWLRELATEGADSGRVAASLEGARA